MITRASLIKVLAVATAFSFGMVPAVVAQVEEVSPDVEAEEEVEEVVPTTDIATIVGSVEGFSTLEAALEAAELTEALSGEGPFTVIAPTNDAFAALPEGVLDALLLPENIDLLTNVLTYHVIPGEVMYDDLEPGTVETLGGDELTVTVEDDSAFVDGIRIVGFDIPATNGLIHVLQDGVLVPTEVATELESRLAATEEESMVEEEITVEETVVEEEIVVEETVVEESTSAEPIRALW